MADFALARWLVVCVVLVCPLHDFPLYVHAAARVATALVLEPAQACVAHHFFEPRSAAGLGWRGHSRPRALVVAALAPRQQAELSQQRLVVVQQAADRQADVLGLVARALVPRRQLGAAVSAELAAVGVRGPGRDEAALDARPRLVGVLRERGRREPWQGHAQPEGE